MKTITNPKRKKHTRAGYASLLVVISVGTGLLLILTSMYENTVEAQAVEKKILMKSDYQQREDAFLRALTSIIPNKAMQCMQDNSTDYQDELSWERIINESLDLSNSRKAVDASVAQDLGISGHRAANVTDSQLIAKNVVNPLSKVNYVHTGDGQVVGHWEDVVVREWVDGYNEPGEWVPGYQEPREWVDGYWKWNRWRWRLEWVDGYWKPGAHVPGHWTDPTWVAGHWNETTERRWVEEVVPGSDPNVTGNLVTSGTNRAATSSFPPPLECNDNIHAKDSLYPLVSHAKKYGSTATGWVADNVEDYPQYNRVLAPVAHFKYQKNNRLIAKHNWWAFELGHSRNDKNLTKLSTRAKKYLISLYEVPSQLAINGSSFTTLGKHADGSSWSNITSEGGIFAGKIKTEGAFSADFLSSRKGVNLSSSSNIGGTTGAAAGTNPFAGNARELEQSKGHIFPITSSSDGGRVAFVPINRGLEFYDRFAGATGSANGVNSVSPTSWNYYSIGANQCTMRLDVTDVVSSANQTPTTIVFRYSKDGTMVEEEFVKGSTWPAPETEEGLAFPFHTKTTASNRPAIAFHSNRLKNFLAARNADQYDVNHSIAFNVDYLNNASIRKPPFPTQADDLAVILLDADDFSAYPKGFSIVANMRLVIADDTNVTPTTPPAGVNIPSGQNYFPAFSMFALEKRYGDSVNAVPISIEGQIGSMAKGNTAPTRIADLKSGAADEVIPQNIKAVLKPITSPAALPPITMMNWMVVVREIHPRYNPVMAPNSTTSN